MIFIGAMALSLLVALLRGGRFDRLGALSFRLAPLILVALLLQILLFTPLLGPYLSPAQVAVGYNLSMIMLWGTLLLNWRVPGAPLMALGIFLNWLVITLNGGFMPASPEALAQAGLLERVTGGEEGRSNNSILLHEGSRLPFLADVMAIPEPLPLANVFSVGDLLLALGAAWLIQRTMTGDPVPPREVNNFSTPP